LAGFLLAEMPAHMYQVVLETFNAPSCQFRALLREHVMWRLPDLTSEKLSDDAISYLLGGLSQRKERSMRGFLLGSIATQHFVETKMLPLISGAREPLKGNLVAELSLAGRRHRRRYVTLEDS
jgi:hypothetical protein